MGMLRHCRSLVWNRVASFVAGRLANGDPDAVGEWMGRLATARTATLPPAAALRFTLKLEDRLGLLDDEAAIRLDSGVHAKHRLMGYHNFFIQHIRPDDAVLDVGCGPGAVAADIADRTRARVTGIDINARSIEMARQRYSSPRLTFVIGDATASVPEGAYTVVVLSNVLEHIRDREQFLRRVMESTGVGRFLIRVPLEERDWRVPLRRELGLEWRADLTHETEYTSESFAREMKSAGLTIREQQFRWGEIWAECVKRET